MKKILIKTNPFSIYYLKLNNIFLLLFSFFLPFRHNISAVFGFLLIILFFIDYKMIRSKINNLKISFYFKVFVSIYFIHLLGFFYTSNFKYAFTDIEIKLPLIIFPIIIFGKGYIEEKLKKNILFSFVLGCFVSSIISFFYAYKKYLITKDVSSFLYEGLMYIMHSSYFSMYLTFSIFIILFHLMKKNDDDKYKLINLGYFFMIIFFIVTIVFLSSRAGLIALILSIFIFIFYLIKLKKYFTSFLILFFYIGSIFLMFNLVPKTVVRFKSLNSDRISYGESPKKIDINSKDLRLVILETSIKLFFERPFFGVGTGDIKDVLVKSYKKDNFIAGFQQKLNCHNQFFQFLIAFGIVGFLVIIFSLYYPVLISIKQGNYIYVYLVILISFNCLFESMLETKAGVEFFSFFNSILFIKTIKKNDLSSSNK